MKKNFTAIILLSLFAFASWGQTLDINAPVAKLNGKASVNLVGNANYQMPINLPDGSNGFKPNLSISYSSGNGNGLLGYGWNINGIDVISREGKNSFFDGQNVSLSLGGNDRFSLNGNRLIQTSAGAYGSNNTKYHLSNEDFNEITSFTNNPSKGPDYFTVNSPTGTKTIYGVGSAQTLPKNLDSTKTGGNIPVYQWFISKSYDANGNVITYTYDNSTGTAYLKRISYGGDSVQPLVNVYFEYQKRTDIITKYLAYRGTYQIKNLLSIITITVGNDTSKSYQLNYLTEGNVSKLQSVGMKDSEGSSINPTVINWNKNIQQSPTIEPIGLPLVAAQKFDFAYFDANSTLDLMVTTQNQLQFYVKSINGAYGLLKSIPSADTLFTADGKVRVKYIKNVTLADKENDGKTEFYVNYVTIEDTYHPNVGNTVVWSDSALYYVDLRELRLNDINNSSSQTFNIIGKSIYTVTDTENPPVNVIYDDFKGDGSKEIIVFKEDELVAAINSDAVVGSKINEEAYDIFSSDLANDGKAELMAYAYGTYYLYGYNSTTNTFQKLGGSITNLFKKQSKPLFGDFSGDGNTDLFCINQVKEGLAVNRNIHFEVKRTADENVLPLAQRRKDFVADYNIEIQFPATFTTQAMSASQCVLYNCTSPGSKVIVPYNFYMGTNNGINFTATIPESKPNGILYYNPYRLSLGANGGEITNTFIKNIYRTTHEWQMYNGAGLEWRRDTTFKTVIDNIALFHHQAEFDSLKLNTTVTSELVDYLNVTQLNSGDYNADGYTDVLKIVKNSDGSSQAIFLINRMGRFEATSIDLPWSENGYLFLSNLDIDQDGTTDVLIQNKTNYQTLGIYYLKGNQQNLVKTITDGIGFATSFEYDVTNEGNYFYQISSDSVPSYLVLQKYPKTVVTAMIQPDGLGGQNSIKYSYQDALAHNKGMGFMGFKKVITTNQNTGIVNTSTYEVLPQSLINVLKSEQITKAENILTQTDYINKTVQIGSNVHRLFTYVNVINSNDFLKGVNIKNTFTYSSSTGELTENKIEVVGSTDYKRNYYGYATIAGKRRLVKSIVSQQIGASPIYSRTTSYTYDPSTSKLTSMTTDPNTIKAVTTNLLAYDSFGNVILKSVVADGKTYSTATEYDHHGINVTKETKLGNRITQIQYHPLWNQPTSITGFDGKVTTFNYDALGRTASTQDYLGNVTQYSYSWSSINQSVWTIKTLSSGKPTQTQFYDVLGRLVHTEETSYRAKGLPTQTLVSDYFYDTQGRLEHKSLPHYGDESSQDYFVYYHYVEDGTQRLKQVIDRGQVTTYNYQGLNTQITDPAIRTKTMTETALGLMDKTADALGNTVAITVYHSSGQPLVLATNGTTITNKYDAYGRKIYTKDPSRGETLLTYDALDRTITNKNANGKVYQYTYNEIGQVVSQVLQGSTGGFGTQYSYVTDGMAKDEVKEMVSDNLLNPNKKAFTYTNKGQLATVTQSINLPTKSFQLTSTYTYNEKGQVATQTYPSGITVSYQYDNNTGQLKSINKSDGTLLTEMYERNAKGQALKVLYGNGVMAQYQYQVPFEQQKKVSYQLPANLGTYSYKTDFDTKTGNLKSRTNLYKDSLLSKQEVFTYDALDRLTAVISSDTIIKPLKMTYDAKGNILQNTDVGDYTYDVLNPYAVVGVTPLSTISAISKATQDITYTPFNKIATIGEGKNKSTWVYGPDQKRWVMTENDSTTILYGSNYEAKTDKQGNIVKEWTYIRGINGQINAIYITQNGQSKLYYPHIDHLGSILMLTDEQGNVAEQNSFDAWGKRRDPQTWATTTLTGNLLRRGYTGHEHLDKYALINMNGRLYDPVVAKMLNADPVTENPDETQSYNRYSYVWNNPLKYNDPTGDCPEISGSQVPPSGNTPSSPGTPNTGTPGVNMGKPTDPNNTSSPKPGDKPANNKLYNNSDKPLITSTENGQRDTVPPNGNSGNNGVDAFRDGNGGFFKTGDNVNTIYNGPGNFTTSPWNFTGGPNVSPGYFGPILYP